MKKLFLIVSLLFISLTAFAQTGVRFGFTASPGISWYAPDNKAIDSEGARFSLNYGALVDIVIGDNERYAIATGLTIDMGGGKLKGTNEETGHFSKLTGKIQYLEIPVGLKLRSNETASNLTFYGTLGLNNGIRIRSRGAYEYTGLGEDEDIHIKESSIKIKNLDFYPTNVKRVNVYQLGLHFEAGTEFRISDNTSIVGGLFFRNGFTNIIKDTDKERVVQRGFGLRVAVMF